MSSTILLLEGSSIFIALLDLSKAFDMVNHFKLFNSLLHAAVPIAVVEVLCNWYAKMFVVLRWNKSLACVLLWKAVLDRVIHYLMSL